MREENYYAIEIVEVMRAKEVKNAYLMHNSSALVLFEKLKANERLEISLVMRPNSEPIRDEFGSYVGEDDDVIEITNIKKVIL